MLDNESSLGTYDPTGCMMFYSSEDNSDNEQVSLRPGVTTRSQSRDRIRSAPPSRPSSRTAKSRSSSRTRHSRPSSRNDHADPHFKPVSPNRHLTRSLTWLDGPISTTPKVNPLPRARSADMTKDLARSTPRKLDFSVTRDPTLNSTDQPNPPSNESTTVM